MKSISNKKAYFNYEILQKFESGIVLQGCEVKSIRAGKVNLSDSYAKIIDNELWLINCHISPYAFGNRHNPDPIRDRKLLMHKNEISKLQSEIRQSKLDADEKHLSNLESQLSDAQSKIDAAEAIAYRREIERIEAAIIFSLSPKLLPSCKYTIFII